MSEPPNSYRQILRSTSIIGGSSVMNILIGLVRVKVLAVLLGPAGVGLAGLYNSIMSTAGTLVGFGLGSSGVRQIAEAGGEPQTLSRVRQALWYANLLLGALGLLLLWLLREPVSRWVFDDTTHAGAVGWLGLGVLLSLIAGSQTALLQGLRRIGDMARLSVLGSLLGTLAGISLIALFGQEGILAYTLAGPVISVGVAGYFVAKVPRPAQALLSLTELMRQWRLMLGLGVVFMVTGLMAGLTQLAVRSLIARDLGLVATGYFQAAWTISMMYIGFVLSAMGADYYPRLTQAIDDRAHANRLVNEQARVALLLAGPVLLGMMAFAPLVINLLYARNFGPTVEILRWQILGDLIKVATWPMAFILLARGAGRLYFLAESAWLGFYLAGVWLGLPRFGLVVTGFMFLLAYGMYFTLIYLVVTRVNGFRWYPGNLGLLFGLALAGILLQVLSRVSVGWTYSVGAVLVVGLSGYSLYQLSLLTQVGGRLGQIAARVRWVVERKGVVHG
ncbi:MAG: O-antigen translocase [Candidatus Competibacteraceae bacterium]